MNRRGFLQVMTLGAVGSALGATVSAPQEEQGTIDISDDGSFRRFAIQPGGVVIWGTPMISEEMIAEQVQRALADVLGDL